MRKKQTLRTVKESKTGRNIRTINLKNLSKSDNKKLIRMAKRGKLPGYHVVNSGNRNEFLRANPNRKRKDNLDPILERRRK